MNEFNLLKQFVAFHQRRELVPLNASEMALYFLLLDRANRCYFSEWFPLGGALIQEELCLNRWALEKARNGLISKGYIQYRAGTRGKKPSYHIIPLYELCGKTTSDTCGSDTLDANPAPTPTQPQHQNQHDPDIKDSTIPAQFQHQHQHNPSTKTSIIPTSKPT